MQPSPQPHLQAPRPTSVPRATQLPTQHVLNPNRKPQQQPVYSVDPNQYLSYAINISDTSQIRNNSANTFFSSYN